MRLVGRGVMKKVRLNEATSPLSYYVRKARQEPLIVTENGKVIAALVPVGGMDFESLSVSTNPEFIDLIERSRRRLQEEGGMTSDEVRRKLGLDTKPVKPVKRARRTPS
jgi:antitoxin (DNA-binding transcriptional repressor) of toxin-antitoxin stability system